MTFRVTNTFTGQTTLDANQLDVNFDDIENKFNGGITGSDMTSNAGITNAQLLHDKIDLILSAQIKLADIIVNADPLVPAIAIPMPAFDSETSYTLKRASVFMNDTGTAGVTTFQVNYSSVDAAAGTITNITNITPNIFIGFTPAPNAYGQFFAAGPIPLAPPPIDPTFININFSAVPTATTANDFISFSFRLSADTGLVG